MHSFSLFALCVLAVLVSVSCGSGPDTVVREVVPGDALTPAQLEKMMRSRGFSLVYGNGIVFAFSGCGSDGCRIHRTVFRLYGGRVVSVLTGVLFADGGGFRKDYDELRAAYGGEPGAEEVFIPLDGAESAGNRGLMLERDGCVMVISPVSDEAEFLGCAGPKTGGGAIGYYVERSDRRHVADYAVAAMFASGNRKGRVPHKR